MKKRRIEARSSSVPPRRKFSPDSQLNWSNREISSIIRGCRRKIIEEEKKQKTLDKIKKRKNRFSRNKSFIDLKRKEKLEKQKRRHSERVEYAKLREEVVQEIREEKNEIKNEKMEKMKKRAKRIKQRKLILKKKSKISAYYQVLENKKKLEKKNKIDYNAMEKKNEQALKRKNQMIRAKKIALAKKNKERKNLIKNNKKKIRKDREKWERKKKKSLHKVGKIEYSKRDQKNHYVQNQMKIKDLFAQTKEMLLQSELRPEELKELQYLLQANVQNIANSEPKKKKQVSTPKRRIKRKASTQPLKKRKKLNSNMKKGTKLFS